MPRKSKPSEAQQLGDQIMNMIVQHLEPQFGKETRQRAYLRQKYLESCRFSDENFYKDWYEYLREACNIQDKSSEIRRTLKANWSRIYARAGDPLKTPFHRWLNSMGEAIDERCVRMIRPGGRAGAYELTVAIRPTRKLEDVLRELEALVRMEWHAIDSSGHLPKVPDPRPHARPYREHFVVYRANQLALADKNLDREARKKFILEYYENHVAPTDRTGVVEKLKSADPKERSTFIGRCRRKVTNRLMNVARGYPPHGFRFFNLKRRVQR